MISNHGGGFRSSPTFSGNGVEEINASKCTSYDRIDGVACALQLNLSIAANMGKDIALAHFDERKFGVVAVGEEIYVFDTRLVVRSCSCWNKKGKVDEGIVPSKLRLSS